MKAIGYYKNLPVTDEQALIDIELPMPQPLARDLLVEVKAVSVNPVDTKVRKGSAPANAQAKVLGWDAAGIVKLSVAKFAYLSRVIVFGTQAQLRDKVVTANISWSMSVL